LVKLLIIKKKDSEFYLNKILKVIWVIFKIINLMVKEKLHLIMETRIKDNGKIIYKMDKVYTNFKMEISMKVVSKKV
jgi:hypothetical protein